MDELSKAAREILSKMREAEAPRPGARDRVLRRLAASIGGASVAVAGTAGASAALGATTSVGAWGGTSAALTAGKVVLWVALGTLAGGALLTPVALLSEAPLATARPIPPKLAAPAKSSPPGPSMAAASSQLELQPEPLRSAAPPTPTAPRRAQRGSAPAASGTLAAETRLLEAVRQQLRNGNPSQSLAVLEQHARHFPNGVLAEEAAASRVLALCALGRSEEVDAERARFRTAFPRSPLGPGVERACSR